MPTEDFKETLKQQADIVRIIGDYIKLKKAGAQNYSGLCPFHGEKTPSFSVHATRQFYHCFGCGVSGDVFSFVQKIENITFPEALRLVAQKLGIPAESLEPYGHYKAKVSLEYIKSLQGRPNGKLILVSAITPTPAGEGKTTTTVGLTDALNRIGKKAMLCIREPSLGPCFGMKGGAAGGGYAQVVPMADINLHFTGDFHAIGAAHNLLAAMIDNHIYWGNSLGLDPRRIAWRRAIDMNDRSLRQIVTSLGGVANGYPREDGFDITVASEVMAIFCLARDLADLKRRMSRLESELAELDAGDAATMRAELGGGEAGLERVVHGAFALLDLIAFFTAGEGKRLAQFMAIVAVAPRGGKHAGEPGGIDLRARRRLERNRQREFHDPADAAAFGGRQLAEGGVHEG